MVGNEFPSEKNLDCLEQVSIPQAAGREARSLGGDHGWAASHLSIGFALRGRVWGPGLWRGLVLSRIDAFTKNRADSVYLWRPRCGMWNFNVGSKALVTRHSSLVTSH